MRSASGGGVFIGPLVLCCLEGLARDQAARRLGVPVGTLRVQLERARERLRTALKKRGIEHDLRITGGGHTWINWRHYLNELAPKLFR